MQTKPNLEKATPRPWQIVRTNDTARRIIILDAHAVQLLTIQIPFDDSFNEMELAKEIVQAINEYAALNAIAEATKELRGYATEMLEEDLQKDFKPILQALAKLETLRKERGELR